MIIIIDTQPLCFFFINLTYAFLIYRRYTPGIQHHLIIQAWYLAKDIFCVIEKNVTNMGFDMHILTLSP